MICVAAGLATGCDDRADDRPDSRAATPRRSATTTPAPSPADGGAARPVGTGTVRGTVTFKGVAPKPEEVPGAKCHGGAAATRTAPVVVSAGGGLQDVMVYLKGAGPVEPGPPPPGPKSWPVLDQVNCQFVPRVTGLRVGQMLMVMNSDPTLHNVHAMCVDNPAVNFGMTAAGQTRELAFDVPERFEVKCDVHPWMTARIHVFDHPFFARTRDYDGGYEIRGVPEGTHTLVFSHPFLGDRERQVTAHEGGAAARVDVTFERGK